MNHSRRNLLKYSAMLPLGVALKSMAGAESNTGLSGGVVLSILFLGPMASIVKDDEVIIYAPKLEDHVAWVETSTQQIALQDDSDYKLSGLPNTAGESIKIFPPLACNAKDAYGETSYPEADRLRNFTIRLKRPNVLQGLRPVDVFLSSTSLIPPDAPMQAAPTGVRFVYRSIPRNVALKLTGPGGFSAEPSFLPEEQAGLPARELVFKYQSLHATDPCHRDSTASFKKLVEMFPESNFRAIKFAHDSASCAMQSSQGLFRHAAYPVLDRHARLLPVVGPGNDCESPQCGSW